MSLPKMRYVILQHDTQIQFVEMPYAYAYQLSALNLRLHKEVGKLTAANVPELPYAIAECDHLELQSEELNVINGLAYMQSLEQAFASINEAAYPLVSLLTEIRALLAQLEQWYEEDAEEQD